MRPSSRAVSFQGTFSTSSMGDLFLYLFPVCPIIPPLQPQLYVSTQILKSSYDEIKTGTETTFAEVISDR